MKKGIERSSEELELLELARELQASADDALAKLPATRPAKAIARPAEKSAGQTAKRLPLTGRITEQAVKQMSKQASMKGRTLWDTEVQGFGVRITAAGVISFVLDYRLARRQHRYTIGRYPELSATAARDEAVELRAKIRKGEDPLEERRALGNEPTFGDLIDDYLKSGEFAKKRKSTAHNYRLAAEKHLRPKLGRLRLKSVSKRDIEKLHAEMKSTPYYANRVLALVSILFNYAKHEEWVAANPAEEVKRYNEDERERYLSKDEIGLFRTALDDYPNHSTVKNPEARERDIASRQEAVNALWLILLTGSRPGEVLKSEWPQFEFDRGMWVKPSHHTKQDKKEHVPLNEAALDLLNSMKPKKASGPLFIGRDGKKARVTIRRPWVQACKAAGLVEVFEVEGKRKGRDGKPRMLKRYKPTVRMYDLRHTFISHLVLNNVPLKVAGRLAGHTQISTTNRYANLVNDDLKTATDKFTNVIPFEKRSA